jgi:hypothetical protein
MTWPGEKLVVRLWETVAEKGIGSLLKPWQIRREGRAHIDVRRDELLVLAQAEKDAEGIRAGTVRLLGDGQLSLPQESSDVIQSEKNQSPALPSLPSMTDAAIRASVVETLRKEINVAKALVQAEAELAEDAQEPPSNKPGDDWLFRWRDAASAVSDEELQQLWGRVLAGEVRSPGQFSLRTLEFLRNISQEEARAIETLSKVAFTDFIYRNEEILTKAGVHFSFLLNMQDLGLLSGVESIGLERTVGTAKTGSYIRVLLTQSRGLLLEHADESKKLKIPIYQITKLGMEVLKLGGIEPEPDFLTEVAQAICKQGFEVFSVRYSRLDESTIRYYDQVRACPTLQPSAPSPVGEVGSPPDVA